MKRPTRAKRPRVVPGLVLSAGFLGVVPACAMVACGGTEVSTKDGGTDAAPDQFLGVGAVAYCCFDASVAVVGFDAEADAADASDGEPGDAADGG